MLLASVPHFLANANSSFIIVCAFLLTLVAHLLSRWLNALLPAIPSMVIAIAAVLGLLWVLGWQYDHYYQFAQPLFGHLLGYVTVMLAIPLASLDFRGIPLKKLSVLISLASFTGAAIPMSLALIWGLSNPTILAFATRSVTTPIGLNVAALIGAPLALASLIIIVSGLIGALLARPLTQKISDDRARGLALGLVAHAFGTVEAWQISPTAGRYAAFGLAINGMLTALWLPLVYLLWHSLS